MLTRCDDAGAGERRLSFDEPAECGQVSADQMLLTGACVKEWSGCQIQRTRFATINRRQREPNDEDGAGAVPNE